MKQFVRLLFFLLFIFSGKAQVEQNAVYQIKNGAHLSYLNASGNNVGDVVTHTSDGSNGRSEWLIIDNGDGYYQIQNVSNKLYVANLGNLGVNAPLKLVANPGGGALWSISGNSSTKFLLKNKISGYFLSSGGNRYQNATMVQSYEGQYSYWGLDKIRGGINQSQSASRTLNNSATTQVSKPPKINWQEISLPSKYFGTWRISSSNSSRNDVSINSQYVKDGAMNKKIVKSYYHEGVYKIIVTYNNYFSSYFIKDRAGGIGGGGIYINSTVEQAFRSEQDAYNFGIPTKLDSGFK